MDYNNTTKKVEWFGHMHRLPEDSPAKQAYKEVTEKPAKKRKVTRNSPGTILIPET